MTSQMIVEPQPVTFAIPREVYDGLQPGLRRLLATPGGLPVAWSVRGRLVESAPLAPASGEHEALQRVLRRMQPPVHFVRITAGTRRCRICGYVEDLACEGGCTWVSEDRCSSCVGRRKPLAYIPLGCGQPTSHPGTGATTAGVRG